MMFVYLLLSLLCSAGQELLAGIFSWRASNLKQAINTLLNDPNASFFAEKFHTHPIIDRLAPAGKSPSYIPAGLFSATVMDLLREHSGHDPFADVKASVETLPEGPLKQSLSVMVARSNAATDEFIKELEQWFDHGMDRASGWYKRKSQKWMFGIALVLAVALNVDSIQIATTISQDSAKREAIVAMAASYPVLKNPTDETVKKLVAGKAEAIYSQLEDMGLPIGWKRDGKSIYENLRKSVDRLSLFGWLITACFVSLGAPFWFNMLGKALDLRAAGKKPEKANQVAKR